jgi:hypothetical protein
LTADRHFLGHLHPWHLAGLIWLGLDSTADRQFLCYCRPWHLAVLIWLVLDSTADRQFLCHCRPWHLGRFALVRWQILIVTSFAIVTYGICQVYFG